jgi:hypothetical protein
MHLRGRSLKYTAVLGFVVLSLTGFTGHGHHSSRGHGSGGGGCSSSSQDHDSSSSSGHNRYYDDDDYDGYDDDDSYGGSGSGGSSVSTPSTPSGHEDGTARLVSCATVKDPYATIEVTNPNAAESGFDVHIVFEDADDMTVNGTIKEVTVPANGTKTFRIPVDNAEESAPEVDHCDLDRVASYHW